MCTYSQPTVRRIRPARSVRRGLARWRTPPRTRFACAALDPAELLDVDMDQLAGAERSYRTAGLRPSPPSRPIPERVRILETVESAIPSVSAISAAVKRNRRSFAIASIRSGVVRLATRRAQRSDP